ISTRSFADRLETLAHVRDAGIKVCSGARCYRVPSVGNVGAWLAALQRRAQREATLDLMHGEAGAYLAIVRAAPQ
ncbi:hypothetical protein ACTJJ7_26935, partial [Phyllobacterium sp. 22229]|uniref:hypothetical protein n=1 Tax=Phyllobacterium sp. 22229 TaxID=3453895 RepID=UPI003F82529E